MTDNYITVNIMGGIGNQLFQISAGLYYANKYNKNLIFCDNDISPSCTPSHGYTVWKTLLNNHFKLLSIEDFNNINFNNIDEKYNEFDKYYEGNINFVGYYQNIKYDFEYSKNYIYNVLINSDLYIKAKNYYNNLKNKYNDFDDNNYCFIHIRRGDFIIGGIYPDLDYINNAYNYIKKNNANTKFFIFSDGIEWCSNNIKYDNLYYIDDINNCNIELLLMTLFKNAIIELSTFAHWGAYLGDKNNIIISKNINSSVSFETNPNNIIFI